MNNQKIYDSLIAKAQRENRKKNMGMYLENHHILPKCLGGRDENINLVLLNAREHFLAHWLLAKIHNFEPKLVYAFNRFCQDSAKNRRPTSRLYKFARELYISLLKNNSAWKKKMAKTMTTLVWIKNLQTGECFRVTEDEIKKYELMGWQRGRIILHRKKHSMEALQKMSKAHIGTKRSDESKRKTAEANKLRSWVNKDNISKWILKDEIEIFIKQGWKLGRIVKQGAGGHFKWKD